MQGVGLPGQMQKQQRASRPKVRTGCITCKSRHVKCDEGRPSCRRCEKAGSDCGGYVDPRHDVKATTVTINRNRPVPILPRPKDEREKSLQHLLRPGLAPIFLKQDDVVYFDLFRNQLVYDLGGQIHLDFWAQTVMREAMADECVQRAVVAIGALAHALYFTSESRWQCVTRTLTPPTLPCTGAPVNPSHRAAMRSYISAITLWAARVQEGAHRSSPASVIIVTLVLVAFELLQGNIDAVDGLMKSGILLLTKSRSLLGQAHQHLDLTAGLATMTEREFDALAHMLPCLSVMTGFTRLCNSQHDFLASLSVGLSDEFPDIEQASLPETMALWTDFYTRNLIFVMQVLRNNCYSHPYTQTETKSARDAFLTHLQKWDGVLSASLVREQNTHDRRGIKIAQIHHCMITVFTHCCLDRTDMAYDNFFPQFQYILESTLALFLEGEPSAKIPFTFCGHLAPPLCLVASKCRHAGLRGQFLEAISRLPRREGPWDSRTQFLGLIGQSRLEDAARGEAGFIPSTSRWSWTGAHWDLERRELVAEYTRVIPNGGLPIHIRMADDIDR